MATLYAFGDVEFDPARGELNLGTRTASLRPRTAAVLAQLADRPRQLVTKDELLKLVWADLVVTDNSLSQCIREIRRELGDAQESLLRTVPKRGYVLDVDVARRAPEPEPPRHEAEDRSGPRRLTVVVLPLANLDGDPDQDYFAEGLTEDLTTDLGRMPNTFVISRGTAQAYGHQQLDVREVGRQLGVRYAVEGSVRRTPASIVVNLALCDTQNGAQIWTERFEDKRAHLASLQRSMAGRVAQVMHIALLEAEAARISGTVDPDAQDLAMRAWARWYTNRHEANEDAKVLAARALALDPECTLAWVVRAHCNIADIALRWTADMAASVDAAEAAIRKALAIEPLHPTANTVLGTVLVYRREFEAALGVFELQKSLNPNFSLAYQWNGLAHIFMGNPRLAIPCFEMAIRLSPRDGRLSTYLSSLAVAYLHAGDDRNAVLYGERSVHLPNPWPRSYERLAAAYGAAGMVEDARAAVRVLLQRWPGYSIARHRAEMVSDRPRFLAQHERYIEGLRAGGLPEE